MNLAAWMLALALAQTGTPPAEPPRETPPEPAAEAPAQTPVPPPPAAPEPSQPQPSTPTPPPSATPSAGPIAAPQVPGPAPKPGASPTTTAPPTTAAPRPVPKPGPSPAASPAAPPAPIAGPAAAPTPAPAPPARPRPEALALAEQFFSALGQRRAEELASLCRSGFSFDGRVAGSAEEVRRRWGEILAARSGPHEKVEGIEMLQPAEALARLGKPPRRLEPALAGASAVALARVGGRQVALFLVRQGSGWAASGMTD